MNILDNHTLAGVSQQIIPGATPMATRRLLVIHFTSGATGQSSINYWKKLGNGICAHLVIERDGTIIQCRAFNQRAGHAGASRWRDPKTGKLYTSANNFSIGIELANAGDSVEKVGGKLLAFGRDPLPAGAVLAKHKNGGPMTQWEAYPAAQIQACKEVSALLVSKYNLDDIAGHEDIAPERKSDPGPSFPMLELRRYCGFTGLPVVHKA